MSNGTYVNAEDFAWRAFCVVRMLRTGQDGNLETFS